MYRQKHGKRFAVSSGKDNTSETIVISSTPVEKNSEPIKPKSPERLPLHIPSKSTEGPVTTGSNYERRRYGRYFARFSQKSASPTPLATARELPSPVSSSSEPITKPYLRECLQECLQEWRRMIPEFTQEIVKYMKLEEQFSVETEETSQGRTKGDFVSYFNDPENRTIDSKTTLDENGYIHLQTGLAGRLFSDEILIYPFGSEKLALEVSENILKMQFKTAEGKTGAVSGRLIKNDEAIYVIKITECWIYRDDDDAESVEFTDLDLPLHVFFEGGLI